MAGADGIPARTRQDAPVLWFAVDDTVATAEIKFGDNDRLAARVASMMGADRLLLLSDVDGLYTADPGKDASAKHIPEVTAITPEIEAMAGGSISGLGRGGFR